MKLDPVFVIAPKPNPPTMPTRRAFLIAGTTFTLGAAAGGACGYSIAAAAGSGPNAAPEAEIPPSGDVELDELRRLAIKAPIEELAGKGTTFLSGFMMDYPHDQLLWRGIERLCEAVLSEQPMKDRRKFANMLAQIIEKGDPRFTTSTIKRVADLRRVK